VCIHSTDKLFVEPKHFRASLRAHRRSMTTLAAVIEEYTQRREGWVDDAFARVWGRAIRMKMKLASRPKALEEDEFGFDAARRPRTIHPVR